MKTFSHHFRSYRHDVTDKAHQYTNGLMQAGDRKNMDRMAEIVPDSNSRNLQQFLTHSKWDAHSVIDQVAQEANELIGDSQQTGLLIDESGFAKQGKNSVAVSRQWLGRLGKVDNGQVAVFGVLVKNHYAIPVGVKLYLPCSDIEDLLSRVLPRRDVNQKEVIRQLEYRHRQRKSAIVSHARKKMLIIERLDDPD